MVVNDNRGSTDKNGYLNYDLGALHAQPSQLTFRLSKSGYYTNTETKFVTPSSRIFGNNSIQLKIANSDSLEIERIKNSPPPPPPPPAIIQGNVLSRKKQPLGGAQITARYNGRRIGGDTSKSNGTFEFKSNDSSFNGGALIDFTINFSRYNSFNGKETVVEITPSDRIQGIRFFQRKDHFGTFYLTKQGSIGKQILPWAGASGALAVGSIILWNQAMNKGEEAQMYYDMYSAYRSPQDQVYITAGNTRQGIYKKADEAREEYDKGKSWSRVLCYASAAVMATGISLFIVKKKVLTLKTSNCYLPMA